MPERPALPIPLRVSVRRARLGVLTSLPAEARRVLRSFARQPGFAALFALTLGLDPVGHGAALAIVMAATLAASYPIARRAAADNLADVLRCD